MNVSEYIVKYLEEVSHTDHAYVIVGGAALWICKALSKAEKLKFTFTNHEQAAVMAADGYARVSGKPGVAFVTNGPALANAVTGMAQAYVDSSPVVLFTGNSGLAHVQFEREHNMRQYGTQDVRTDLLMKPVTKKYYLLDDPAKTGEILADAFSTAAGGRPGPVCIEVPVSVQSMQCTCAFPPEKAEESTVSLSEETVRAVLKQLREAKRPLILAGQGVRLSDTAEELHQLAQALDVPVVNSRMGIDTMESSSRYFVGRCGNHGSRASHFALQTCDVLLVLGSRLAPNTTGYNVRDFSKQSHKILIEIDPTELVQWGVAIDETHEGDLRDFFHQALDLIRKEDMHADHGKWLDTCEEWKMSWPIVQDKFRTEDVINSYQLVDTVTKHAAPGDLVIADTGSSCSVVAQVWDVKKDQRVFISGGLSGMGYWATSMGLAEAYGKKGRVICFVGDGSLQMNIQEFATLHAYNIPVKLFVVTNDGYQFVRMSQSSYDINPTFGTDISDGVPIPDIEKVTKAYGLNYLSCKDPAMLDETVEQALNMDGPVVCEVTVTKNLNVEPRIRSIAASDGTFIMPAYENLYPYLEEEVLKAELRKAME
jgi:acetolactate synthase-1/2/3 large subunit